MAPLLAARSLRRTGRACSAVSPPTNYKAQSNSVKKVTEWVQNITYMIKEGDADEWHGKPANDWETRDLEEPRGVVDEGRDGAHCVDSVEAKE